MIDLRELMVERSAGLPPFGHLLLGEVQQKITRRSRRRIVAAAAGAIVVLLLFGGYQFIPALRPSPNPPAATPSPTPEGWPQYLSGGRLAAQQTAAPGALTVSLTWTPSTLDFSYRGWCSGAPQNIMIEAKFLMNGRHFAGAGCDRGNWARIDPEGWAALGVRAGEPSTLTVNLFNAMQVNDNVATPAPFPAGMFLHAAIYERVPFESYQLPPRPDPLKPLPSTYACLGANAPPIVRNDPADPLRPMSTTVGWRDFQAYYVQSQTPGSLVISVNHTEMEDWEWWDYEAGVMGGLLDTRSTRDRGPGWILPQQGDLVTITITPRHMTGAWQFQIHRQIDGSSWGWCTPASPWQERGR